MALEAWLESGSTMAKLLQAVNLVNRQVSNGSEFSEETVQRPERAHSRSV